MHNYKDRIQYILPIRISQTKVQTTFSNNKNNSNNKLHGLYRLSELGKKKCQKECVRVCSRQNEQMEE